MLILDLAGCRARLRPGLQLRINPVPFVPSRGNREGGLDLPILARLEVLDLFLAVDKDRERRCLYPPHRRQ